MNNNEAVKDTMLKNIHYFTILLLLYNNNNYIMGTLLYKLTINILLITIKAILKTYSINKNVFTSKKKCRQDIVIKTIVIVNNNMEKQPDKKEIDNKKN